MKSRTSSSKLTLLRKDIFRFAPLWGIYLIGGLLVMLSTINTTAINRGPLDLAETMAPFAVVNLIYAVLVALMLFGDLYNTRMCYALHSLPMRREKWFLTHVISGFLYSFVPHLIATLLFIPLLKEFCFVAWAWLLSMTLQYLFFFGLAVLAALLCGNRFAALAVYTILNFVSLIVYWFAQTLYLPLLDGVLLQEEAFFLFCPVVQMVKNQELLNIRGQWLRRWSDGSEWVVTYEGIGSGWGYLAVCAGVGLVLLGIALLVYRKRKLEYAGDFLAVKPLEPVFAVVLTLCAGCTFTMFGSVFGIGGELAFFVAGLIVGWFGGQMLLQRTVKVFKGKVFLKLGILILALALSLGLTAWDPLGITTYVPDVDRIERVEFGLGDTVEDASWRPTFIDTTDKEIIQSIADIHNQLLLQEDTGNRYISGYTIRYTLKSGRQVTRWYRVYKDQAAWPMINDLPVYPKGVFNTTSKTVWMRSVVELFVWKNAVGDGDWSQVEEPYDAKLLQRELMDALWQDCEEGHVNQWIYMGGGEEAEYAISISMSPDPLHNYLFLYVTDEMEHCQAWLEKYKDVLKYPE